MPAAPTRSPLPMASPSAPRRTPIRRLRHGCPALVAPWRTKCWIPSHDGGRLIPHRATPQCCRRAVGHRSDQPGGQPGCASQGAGLREVHQPTTADAGEFPFWGEAVLSGFDGEDHDLSINGEEVFTTLLGGGWCSGQWQVGTALVHCTGSGACRPSHDGAAHGAGEVKRHLTGLCPYAHHALNSQLSLWGVVGHGREELTLTPVGEGSRRRH